VGSGGLAARHFLRHFFRVCLASVTLAAAAWAQSAPLTLADCVRLALDARGKLSLAQNDLRIAQQGVVAARTGFLPQVQASGGYTYSVSSDYANRPVDFVSWGDAARFANWLTAPQGQRMCRRQLPGLTENGAWLGDIAQREIFLDRQRVDVARQAPMREDGLQFGAEEKLSVGQQRVKHRLDRQPIAREKQCLGIAIPQRKGKHAAESLDAILAPGLPGMNDHLGIAARVEDMPQSLQLGNQFLVVVNFPVEDDADALVLVV